MSQQSHATYDFAIIGCGIAGASLAYELSSQGAKVLVLEAETQAAYHTTGRSAAFYMEAYGNDTVRNITTASRDFFNQPPEGFCEQPLLKPCGALYIANTRQQQKLEFLYQQVNKRIEGCKLVDGEFIKGKIPSINNKVISSGFWEPQSKEIDVAQLMQGYIKLATRQHVAFIYDYRVSSLSRENQVWQIGSVRDGSGNNIFRAKCIINAAGAWADSLALMAGAKALALIPKKRTICIAKPPSNVDVSLWPLTIDIDEKFYFKPEGRNLLITPADESLSTPHDVQADELDVATGIERCLSVLEIKISHVVRQWAGLRTFANDNSPVVGYDTEIEDFFWMAGQGGYGIQMAPALAKLACGLALQLTSETSSSLNSDAISPTRFAKTQ